MMGIQFSEVLTQTALQNIRATNIHLPANATTNHNLPNYQSKYLNYLTIFF